MFKSCVFSFLLKMAGSTTMVNVPFVLKLINLIRILHRLVEKLLDCFKNCQSLCLTRQKVGNIKFWLKISWKSGWAVKRFNFSKLFFFFYWQCHHSSALCPRISFTPPNIAWHDMQKRYKKMCRYIFHMKVGYAIEKFSLPGHEFGN